MRTLKGYVRSDHTGNRYQRRRQEVPQSVTSESRIMCSALESLAKYFLLLTNLLISVSATAKSILPVRLAVDCYFLLAAVHRRVQSRRMDPRRQPQLFGGPGLR